MGLRWKDMRGGTGDPNEHTCGLTGCPLQAPACGLLPGQLWQVCVVLVCQGRWWHRQASPKCKNAS